jgi:uncharacterized membrane-anchored protein
VSRHSIQASEGHDFMKSPTFTDAAAKVPQVALLFWIIKIAATTLGETGGDTVSMSMGLGYLVSTVLFVAGLVVLVAFQIKASQFHPALYWATIIASTTAGTTIADYADRSLGIGYAGGSILLASGLANSLLEWRATLGTISVQSVATPKAEIFYWVTITFSQTLGTALGDWVADQPGVGYLGGAVVFAIPLLVLVALYRWTSVSRIALFWAAFILTRPLGATVGDFLDKPLAKGGLDLSRPLASLVLAAFIGVSLIVFRQRASEHAH